MNNIKIIPNDPCDADVFGLDEVQIVMYNHNDKKNEIINIKVKI